MKRERGITKMMCKKVEGLPFGFSLCKYWLNVCTGLQLHWSRLKHFVDWLKFLGFLFVVASSICGLLRCWVPCQKDFWKEVNSSLLVPALEMGTCESTSTLVGFSSCICTGMQVLTLVLHRSFQTFGCYFQVWVKKKVGSQQNGAWGIDEDRRLPAYYKLVLNVLVLDFLFWNQHTCLDGL